MTQTLNKPCPIEGCPFQATLLGLCTNHMAFAPAPVRAEIYQLVKRHKGGPSHLKAIRRACIYVHEKLARWKEQHAAPESPARTVTTPYRDD